MRKRIIQWKTLYLKQNIYKKNFIKYINERNIVFFILNKNTHYEKNHEYITINLLNYQAEIWWFFDFDKKRNMST